jgi:hypothetical protein
MVDFPGLAAVFERIVLRRADFGAVELGYQSHRRLDPRHATDILLAIDSNEDFIQVPNIPQAALAPLQFFEVSLDRTSDTTVESFHKRR